MLYDGAVTLTEGEGSVEFVEPMVGGRTVTITIGDYTATGTVTEEGGVAFGVDAYFDGYPEHKIGISAEGSVIVEDDGELFPDDGEYSLKLVMSEE